MGLSFKWLRWLPWNFLIKKMAHTHGFLDPVVLLSQLQRFTQPSEVNEPVELLRAGAILHARGLINSRVIQHNLDWVWPYWVEQQFDPMTASFIPRAFSITHINLTHRNWTAVGLPTCPELPIVDPRGLLTPFLDQWSLDVWVIRKNKVFLLPSRTANNIQQLHYEPNLHITTQSHIKKCVLTTKVELEYKDKVPVCCLDINVETDQTDTLAIVLRPYNPEGVSFIYDLELSEDSCQWIVNNKEKIIFERPIEKQMTSDYHSGDVYSHLKNNSVNSENKTLSSCELSHQCDIGMLTAAALFKLSTKQTNQLRVSIPLAEKLPNLNSEKQNSNVKTKLKNIETISAISKELWQSELNKVCHLQIPDKKMQFLYESAVRTLVLHSVDKVYPGPYTYKRFWYRDATFIIHALLCIGLTERAEKALDYFPKQQAMSGYFHSQEGEWDSNGQALWIFSRFYQMTRKNIKSSWYTSINKGAYWLIKKRLPDNPVLPHSGLLPAGFSAEHLGPNDYYYWDDFWAVAGLQAASQLAEGQGDINRAKTWEAEAGLFQQAIQRSLTFVKKRIGEATLTASPYRRLDAGAIGSLVAGYPLQLSQPHHEELINTTNFLLKNCMVRNGFFQDMIHSGINPYLTLHIAQVLLRAGDLRFFDLMSTVAQLASSTGQWPEAIHPHTGGGCMGDGQHTWAAAEWLLMIRNCFVREEPNRLILVSGIMPSWWQTGERLSFGVAPTQFGPVSISLHYKNINNKQSQKTEGKIFIKWQGDWYDEIPMIDVHLPGYKVIKAQAKQSQVIITPEFKK